MGSMKDREKVTLKNIDCMGSVGVSDWERKVRTRLAIDIEIQADLSKACKSDDLNDTISYAKLYDLAYEVVTRKHHNLLESLAQEIADAVFTLHDCDIITVRIRKPHPPVNGACDYAEVEVVRHKANRQ
jgi:dihydroneopterin aldolase